MHPRRRSRRLAMLASLLGATALAIWLAPTFLPWAGLEARVAGLLGERIGAPVQVRGLRGELLPRPVLLADAVELRLEPMVLVDGIRAELALWPLLRGRIVVVDLSLERLSGLPLQLPTALLGRGDTLQGQLDSSRLDRIQVAELELLPGDPAWRASVQRQPLGWKAGLDRDGQRFEALWTPADGLLAIEARTPPGSLLAGKGWVLPAQASWTMRWQADGIAIERFEAQWAGARAQGQARLMREADQRFRIEGQLDGLRLDAMMLVEGLEAHGTLGGPFWMAASIDAGGTRIDGLRFDGSGALQLRGRAASGILAAAGSNGNVLELPRSGALLEWAASGLRVRRIEAEGNGWRWMGHLAIDANNDLRGELAAFGPQRVGQRLRVSGRREAPAWTRAGRIAAPPPATAQAGNSSR